ncbi:glycosyltransferase family 4 protein [Paraliomyxa miuraensis]|uniref:glycosyltransferase family 4 protein n=1 Tax=Paraliomyxa miuraensis TaxID=376150 RepID=UPI00225491CC|nr:glycosyltransferase family 4 protein [Paraliomyxa miuraensis]MCX4243505.1 glycosyltransferase family 4 protein [Paraliomyxa miuraensis]
MSTIKALLLAEAANPDWTSVPLVGWSHARALFDVVDAHLVTQVRNVEAIEKAGLVRGRELTAIDSEAVASPLFKAMELVRKVTGLGWTFETAMGLLPYYYYEARLWRRFGPEIRARKWDVVHRITPLSPTIPSIIAARCKEARVPFVWGPINGGVPWPPGFGHVQRREGEWLHYVRNAYRVMPGYRSTQRDTTAIIAGSRATFDQLSAQAKPRTVYVPENAIDPARFGRAKSGPVATPLRVAFVGRLVAYKGVDMLLEATAELMRAGKLVLDVIGDGPERGPLAQQIESLGLAPYVRLEGWVEHRLLEGRLLESDVFGFPSVREFGGGVVLEAMALGLVPVIADYAGPAELVTDATGFRVPLGSREQLVAGMRRTLESLVEDPSVIRPMGERARARVLEHYTWEAKARQTLEIYRWVLGQRDKPDFGMPFPD